MFGEIHDRVLVGSSPPIKDSYYVMSLLPRLRKIGYGYLALEVNEKARENCHSNDMVRCYVDYKKNKRTNGERYPYAKPGWIELMKKAIDLNFEIKFIDSPLGSTYGDPLRDKKMFEKMKNDIFDTDGKAKVVVYIGANHISEYETSQETCSNKRKSKPLGFFLEEYTRGRNFSVYMGYPHDTPVGCDLIISDFIWNTLKKN
jgi:hypothetical protein